MNGWWQERDESRVALEEERRRAGLAQKDLQRTVSLLEAAEEQAQQRARELSAVKAFQQVGGMARTDGRTDGRKWDKTTTRRAVWNDRTVQPTDLLTACLN